VSGNSKELLVVIATGRGHRTLWPEICAPDDETLYFTTRSLDRFGRFDRLRESLFRKSIRAESEDLFELSNGSRLYEEFVGAIRAGEKARSGILRTALLRRMLADRGPGRSGIKTLAFGPMKPSD